MRETLKTIQSALIDEKSKVMVPLGVLAALVLAHQVWIHQQVLSLRVQINEPSDQTVTILEDIAQRLMRIEQIMMEGGKND